MSAFLDAIRDRAEDTALDYAADDRATLRTFDADCECAEERHRLAESIRIERSAEDLIARCDDADATAIVTVIGRLEHDGSHALAAKLYRDTVRMAHAGSRAHRMALSDLAYGRRSA